MTGVRGTALVTERRAGRAGATTSGDKSGDGLSSTTRGADLTPTVAWSRRVRWVGGLIQAAFAAFWLVRGSVVLGSGVAAVLIVVFGVIVIGVFVYAIRVAAGMAPRPRSPEGKRIERAVTIATVIEFAAAIALPVIVSGAGHSDWVLPSVAITIGPLLLWLDYRVHIPALPAGRMGVDGRASDLGGCAVRHGARGDDRPGRRCPPPCDGRGGLSRPRRGSSRGGCREGSRCCSPCERGC
jgi:hypothetical protein